MIEEIKVAILSGNSNKPMWRSVLDSGKENDDLNLNDPYSKMSCLILYLYSMKLGNPPLYFEINRICR